MKNDLFLIIDMQNVYLPGEEWACPSVKDAIKNVRRILDADVVQQVIFTKFMASDAPQGTWKQYNQEYKEINENTYLCELVEDLQPYAEKWPVYEKSTYSSLKVEEIREKARHAKRIVLAGVVAECCVLATLMEAIDDGLKVIYLKDCIAGQSSENEACIQKIAERFSTIHTQVMDCSEYLNE